jgi:hypothetical protein
VNYIRYIVLIFGGILIYRLLTTPSWQDGISDVAASVVKPALVPLVELINKPAFVYSISFLIVLAAFAICLVYWQRVLHGQVRRLKELRSAFDELPIPDRWNPELCASAMQRAGEALRRADLFLSGWAMFQRQREREGTIPAAPFVYFAASDPSVDEDQSGGFMQSMPSYFISVGLIFTFIGLVVALYFAGRGFRSGNLEEARASIVELFNASSFKFLTSVAALFSSLVVSVVYRFSKSLLRQETENTITRVERFIGPWRELEHAQEARPVRDVAERLEVLISRIDALSSHLTGFLDRL